MTNIKRNKCKCGIVGEDEIKETLERVEKKLVGNGQRGICDIVNEHDVTIKNIKYGIYLGFTILGVIILFANYFKI